MERGIAVLEDWMMFVEDKGANLEGKAASTWNSCKKDGSLIGWALRLNNNDVEENMGWKDGGLTMGRFGVGLGDALVSYISVIESVYGFG